MDFEKLGSFYLGRSHDPKTGETSADLVLYDSRDLVTHGVCVGMTGSGKTGLCVGLLEEAAIDGVPALVVDPKGDLANLLLTFPELRASDFRPWVQVEEATRKGLSPDEFAAKQAALWKKGLAEWGQDGERIRRLRAAADFTVYTPGSHAGVPVSILKSFAAPPPAILEDADLRRERISTTVTSLLGLLGVDADPIQSAEHILLSNLLDAAWSKGQDVDLGELIRLIQEPGIKRIGVMDLESFYPSKRRFELAMRLNNLLAAPGFQSWMEGEALDVQRMLYTPEGKPRISIFSIAHLSDPERMFFVSLLFNEALGWMRTQSGTSSLRALLYMDEIAGYLPPVANPPSKAPLLTMLKQARAFGFGVVLSTQNPVDIDYKALSNAGTWFIGRLQTERDKARLLDGLESAQAAAGTNMDRSSIEKLISGLGKRVFMLHNVHEDHPEVFHTRWVMSYLRGPMTREELKRLTAPQRADAAARAEAEAAAGGNATARGHVGSTRPVLPPGVPECALPTTRPRPADAQLVYRPMLCGSARLRYSSVKAKVDEAKDLLLLAEVDAGDVAWDDSQEVDLSDDDLLKEPDEAAEFEDPDPAATQKTPYKTWTRELRDWLYHQRRLTVFHSKTFKAYSKASETEGDFRIRLRELAREQRDLRTEKLRAKYGPKRDRLEDKIRAAELTLEKEQEQQKSQKTQTVISVGKTLLQGLLGRKKFSVGTLGSATTAARGVGRARKEAMDVERAKEKLADAQVKLAELEEAVQEDLEELEDKFDADSEELETVSIRAKKTDITVERLALAWVPFWQTDDGRLMRA